MKYILLVGDGMADIPVAELGNRTPLEVAKTPNLDFMARGGRLGRAKTVPSSMKPASDIANLSILGYDPHQYYSGRAPLEAANLGVELEPDDVVFRCNLICVFSDIMRDYSAGHISTKEAQSLIKSLQDHLGTDVVRFFSGISYRHLVLFKKGALEKLEELDCTPPHDITGKQINKFLPKGKNAQIVLSLMEKSKEILSNHEINQVRLDLKENPANMIWLWGQGKKPQMPSFKEMFNLTGSVISAVDLIKGLGKIIGLDVLNVPGATGYYDTDYLGKANAALRSLEKHDFVFVHVEAPDEAGHNGDLREKLNAIERFDQLVVGTILNGFKKKNNFRILALPDHPTPVSLRTHTSDPVPFVMYGKDITSRGFLSYSERQAQLSDLVFDKGYELLKFFTGLIQE